MTHAAEPRMEERRRPLERVLRVQQPNVANVANVAPTRRKRHQRRKSLRWRPQDLSTRWSACWRTFLVFW